MNKIGFKPVSERRQWWTFVVSLSKFINYEEPMEISMRIFEKL